MGTSHFLENVKQHLSPSRFSTYERAAGSDESALALYGWNLEVSAAFWVVLSVCEVVVRNAVVEALEAAYGDRWAYEESFLISLQQRQKEILEKERRRGGPIASMIPAFSFSFWQGFFTARFREKLWRSRFEQIFPYMAWEPSNLQRIHEILERLRTLRNRIAHHEPIFNRDLENLYSIAVALVSWRCQDTADWLDSIQEVTALLSTKPKFS